MHLKYNDMYLAYRGEECLLKMYIIKSDKIVIG